MSWIPHLFQANNPHAKFPQHSWKISFSIWNKGTLKFSHWKQDLRLDKTPCWCIHLRFSKNRPKSQLVARLSLAKFWNWVQTLQSKFKAYKWILELTVTYYLGFKQMRFFIFCLLHSYPLHARAHAYISVTQIKIRLFLTYLFDSSLWIFQ